jgi:hypothetical protein
MLAWMIGCWKIFGKFPLGSVCKEQRHDRLLIAGAINIPNLALPESAVCSGLTGLLCSGIITAFVSLLSKRSADL